MRSVMTVLLALLLGLVPATAQTSNPAEAFVSKTIIDGFAILGNANLSMDGQAAQLESLLLSASDMRRIALYTLGDAKADPAQREFFVAAFRDYAVAVYRQQFEGYRGKTLAVTGSRHNAPGDTVVRAMLNDRQAGLTVPIDFRVRTDGPSPLIIDVGFAGIWLAVTQHDDFAAYLARNKGDVGALTAWLRERAENLR
jgi:phospholipid transport system substrate-binding protein